MQRLVGDKSLQPRILVAQPPQLLQFAQVHPTILTFPPMEGRRADVRFPADGRYRLATLRPAHDRYDLLRRMSFSFSFGHLIPFVIAQSLISDGSVRVSQVNGSSFLRGEVRRVSAVAQTSRPWAGDVRARSTASLRRGDCAARGR